MSRVGKEPVKIPEKVEVKIEGRKIFVKGPKGELELKLSRRVAAKVKDGEVILTRENDQPQAKADHGLYQRLTTNMMVGVTEGYKKVLEIRGLGYKVATKGPKKLELHIGYVHPVEVDAPEGISFSVENDSNIVVEGIDKALVGNVAAKVRSLKKPEPYKGKGIRYIDEVVKIKVPRMAKTDEE